MLLYKMIQMMNSPKDRREIKKFLLESEYYEDLTYESLAEFVLVKEQIQLGRTPKLDFEEIRA